MITISDSNFNIKNIDYIFACVDDTVNRLGGYTLINNGNQRSELVVSLDDNSLKYIRPTLEDKIADVIAVSYKYYYFKRNVRAAGLLSLEFELLLSALISADIDDDKKYIRSKIRNNGCYSIDGSFNFTMKALKEKWKEVVSYIPSVFVRNQLKDFVAYLVKEKCGKRVVVDNGKVYDRHYNRLNRALLTENYDEARIIKEIILSSSGEVELSSKLPEVDEFYLKEFFGDKIFFRNSYFT